MEPWNLTDAAWARYNWSAKISLIKTSHAQKQRRRSGSRQAIDGIPLQIQKLWFAGNFVRRQKRGAVDAPRLFLVKERFTLLIHCQSYLPASVDFIWFWADSRPTARAYFLPAKRISPIERLPSGLLLISAASELDF